MKDTAPLWRIEGTFGSDQVRHWSHMINSPDGGMNRDGSTWMDRNARHCLNVILIGKVTPLKRA